MADLSKAGLRKCSHFLSGKERAWVNPWREWRSSSSSQPSCSISPSQAAPHKHGTSLCCRTLAQTFRDDGDTARLIGSTLGQTRQWTNSFKSVRGSFDLSYTRYGKPDFPSVFVGCPAAFLLVLNILYPRALTSGFDQCCFNISPILIVITTHRNTSGVKGCSQLQFQLDIQSS
ncbi:hypothetical protein RvY_18769-3 [Ramazzottius varieornatus]|uniref:Uncharacterized protein n=1 Tax=Ramazzottius varieornatus TaxID=947166 RepID=A0A1D1WBQ3_RAMVA|nr:hypothetical protein RvY_18769-3 [Ramazzottius varieornatus]